MKDLGNWKRKVQIIFKKIFINYDHNNFLGKYIEQGQIKFDKEPRPSLEFLDVTYIQWHQNR